jgi:hypothetical protein
MFHPIIVTNPERCIRSVRPSVATTKDVSLSSPATAGVPGHKTDQPPKFMTERIRFVGLQVQRPGVRAIQARDRQNFAHFLNLILKPPSRVF